ncbi:uroporphyrinogen decarboxylase (uro-d) [Lucifera butyrica]|uniref:Uroporphyrinogen decarboxylase (Uro-d) n=1 Tax=Lucifera butyrica TaxID=1351585 RepID=A0A498R237_9FIRM|nr:uroporphyrinogen decarboxylase family protein [Lucifera butyrica]VBB05225.1 uroporphyrinogen decarboxylase (uro-d) [Lucifera butyrica]
MNREQLTLDVIRRKNTNYLPSQIEFTNLRKKMEIGEYLGLKTEAEVDSYLGNHIKWTTHLDDVPTKELYNQEKMVEAEREGRVTIHRDKGTVVDGWGMEFELTATTYFNMAHPLKEVSEKPELLANFKAPPLPVEIRDVLFRSAEADLKKYSGDFLVYLSGYNGIWEKGYNLVGIEDFMCYLAAEPEIACRIMDVVCDYKVEMARECGKRGFKIGHFGDDLGTQISTLISEDMFVKYFKPRYAKVFAAFKEAGIPVQMHSCGRITPFIPHLIEIGLDVLEPVQTCMDIRFLKREYGNDLIFYGGVDTQELLAFKTPQEVYDETMRTIEILGKNGGYICGPSQEIMNNVPVENTIALAKAIRKSRGED